jgi:transcriptional regulator with XRE-family HTH domain
MTVDNEINGSLLKLKRESLGWTLADMAARACLSTKQVRQLEEGGDNSLQPMPSVARGQEIVRSCKSLKMSCSLECPMWPLSKTLRALITP